MKRQKWLKWTAWTLLVVGGVAVLRTGVATTCYIPSGGMENSLLPGDHILVNRWSYGWRLPLMGWLGYHRWCTAKGERGDIALFNHPAEVQTADISRRALYIGRLLGLPGDTLYVDSLYNVDASAQLAPDNQTLYAYDPTMEQKMDSLLVRLTWKNRLLSADTARHIRSFSRYEHYLLQQASDCDRWLFPLTGAGNDSLMRPLVVPAKGQRVKVTPWNITLLRNTLVLHEHRQAEIRYGQLCVDGIPVSSCSFTQDYYWVGTNNPVNLSDSRLFGFVPQSHLIGRATRIWLSQQPGHGLFGGYRWDRVGLPVK